MKNKKRGALKQLKEFEQRGGDISQLQIREEVLYTGSHTYTVTLNPQVPGEKELLEAIFKLPSRRRGPFIRDLAVQTYLGLPAGGKTLAVPQTQASFALPVAGPQTVKSALDKMDEGW